MGEGGGVRLSKNPRGETNRRLKPTQAILIKTIHKTRRQAGGFSLSTQEPHILNFYESATCSHLSSHSSSHLSSHLEPLEQPLAQPLEQPLEPRAATRAATRPATRAATRSHSSSHRAATRHSSGCKRPPWASESLAGLRLIRSSQQQTPHSDRLSKRQSHEVCFPICFLLRRENAG